MKIAYVVPGLGEKGGIQEFALTIYGALTQKHDIDMMDWRDRTGTIRRGLMKVMPQGMAADMYERTNRKDIPGKDIVHYWHPEPAIGSSGRFVVSVHGMEIMEGRVRGYRRLAYERVFENASYIHANSRFTAETLEKTFDIPHMKVRVIHPPLTTGISHHRIRHKKPVIGTLSRFVRRKNIPAIIDALDILHAEGMDFTYLLAGDGGMRKEIMSRLKKASFEWKYLGEISERYKRDRFYPSLDVFVLPVLQLPDDVEGFGMVYLEANAYGVPVVASMNGGVPDAVRPGVSGIFADPTKPEDIAKKTGFLLEHHGKYGKSAREWASAFLPGKIAPSFERMYEDML